MGEATPPRDAVGALLWSLVLLFAGGFLTLGGWVLAGIVGGRVYYIFGGALIWGALRTVAALIELPGYLRWCRQFAPLGEVLRARFAEWFAIGSLVVACIGLGLFWWLLVLLGAM
jgi:hypothetical protein